MSSSNRTATLSSLLVSKKPVEPKESRPVRRVQASAAEDDPGYYKALTLKVDKPRFTRLKALGLDRNLPSQALMTEALDLLFARHQR